MKVLVASFCFLAVVGTFAQPSGAPWPLERQDRYGTGRAVVGPDPATLEGPWISHRFSPNALNSHGAALGENEIGFFGTWNDKFLNRFNFKTMATLGNFDALNFVQCTPAIGSNGLVYISTSKNSSQDPPGRIFAINQSTMDWEWFFQTDADKISDWQSASPVLGPDGDVIAVSTNGKVWRLNGNTGAIVWERTLQSVRYTPAFSRDDMTVYVSNGSRLTALSYADGSTGWEYNAGTATAPPGVGHDDGVVFGSESGTVYALNDDGSLRWTFTALGAVTVAPAFSADGFAYVGSWDRRLYKLRMSDGMRPWSFTTAHEFRGAPAIVGHDGRIYCAVYTGRIYSIAPDGQQIWFGDIFGQLRGPITLGPEGELYVGRAAAAHGFLVIRQHRLEFTLDALSIDRGILISGGLQELTQSNDEYLRIRPGIVLGSGEAPARVIVETTTPYPRTSKIRFSVECAASATNMTQTVEIQNQNAGTWEILDARLATGADSVVTVEVTSDANRFVNESTGKIRVRLSWKQVGPVLNFPWQARIDHVYWSLLPELVP